MAFSTLNENKGKFIQEIIDSTLRVMDNSENNVDTEEVQEFSAYISNHIVNFGQKIMETHSRLDTHPNY